MSALSPLTLSIPAKADPLGRQWLPLWLHLADTAGVMRHLYEHWLPESEKRLLVPGCDEAASLRTITLLGFLHDLGKATPAFAAHIAKSSGQAALTERMEAAGWHIDREMEYDPKHAAAGEVLATRRFGMEPGLASVIGGHHGRPQDQTFDPESLWANKAHRLVGRKADREKWQQAQDELVRRAEEEAGLAVKQMPAVSQAAQTLLCGLLIMADWIASNTCYFPLLPVGDDGRSVNTAERLNKAIQRLRLHPAWQAEASADWGDAIFDLRFGQGEESFIPHAAQRETARAAADMSGPGLMILEAPMGSGKTEAALAAAELLAAKTGAGGLFFGLPTQATANAIFHRLLSWFAQNAENSRQSVQLSHRMAALNPDFRDLLAGSSADVHTFEDDQDSTGLEVHRFFQGRKTALLASFCVGTVDQLLMAALRRKHVMLRQLGLAGKVVIVDEAHAYDAYMSQYLQRALHWLGAWGVPVILLSATLPAQTRAALMDAYLEHERRTDDAAPWRTSAEYPLLTWSDAGTVRQKALTADGKQTPVRLKRITDEDRLPLLAKALAEDGCAGVICNTVQRAQELAWQVMEAMPDIDIILDHARFVMPHRTAIEQRLTAALGKNGARPRRMVLIGTQVIEQSLDIDLDYLITDLCPMDLLLQRIGRLHRHQRTRPEGLRQAMCCVTALTDEEIGRQRIYAPYLLLRTRALLPEAFTLPEDIAPLVQAAYSGTKLPGDETEAFREARRAMEREQNDKKQRADAWRLAEPAMSSRRSRVTLHGLLDNRQTGSEQRAEAAVRDSGGSVEVLALRRCGEGRAMPLTEQAEPVSLARMPSFEEAVTLARQRLKLPWALCTPWTIDRTIAELEEETRTAAPEWQQSPWLQGELLLLLDEGGEKTLNGYRLRYDPALGLMCEKTGENIAKE